jgi:DsbC/DsbD-like thiol-disulfide interchange protein
MAAAFIGAAAPSPVQAGSASSWSPNIHAATRLIVDKATWKGRGDRLFAGVHIKLDKGWKTYWRHPGDSGLPPRFDWSGSRNLKEARILWPAPTRFHDNAGTTIGYKKEVVFPFLIAPEAPGEPVNLDVKVEFAVCANICIPVEAHLKLKAGRDGLFSRSYVQLLSRFLNRVPENKASTSGSGPSISHSEAVLVGDAPHLTVDARFPGGTEGADLFIEGPEGFYLPPTEPVGKHTSDTVRFKVDLTKGDDPKDLRGKTVTLTLVSEAARLETSWHIE